MDIADGSIQARIEGVLLDWRGPLWEKSWFWPNNCCRKGWGVACELNKYPPAPAPPPSPLAFQALSLWWNRPNSAGCWWCSDQAAASYPPSWVFPEKRASPCSGCWLVGWFGWCWACCWLGWWCYSVFGWGLTWTAGSLRKLGRRSAEPSGSPWGEVGLSQLWYPEN